jgi:hypothetical protein
MLNPGKEDIPERFLSLLTWTITALTRHMPVGHVACEESFGAGQRLIEDKGHEPIFCRRVQSMGLTQQSARLVNSVSQGNRQYVWKG